MSAEAYLAATASGVIDSTNIRVCQEFDTELVADFFAWADIGKPRRHFRRDVDTSGQIASVEGRNHPLFQAIVDYELAAGDAVSTIHLEARFSDVPPATEGTAPHRTEALHVDNNGGSLLLPRYRMASSALPTVARIGVVPIDQPRTFRQINQYLIDNPELVDTHTTELHYDPFEVIAVEGLGIHGKRQNFGDETIHRGYLRALIR